MMQAHTLEAEFALFAALYSCDRSTRYILHFCRLKTGRCGWLKGRQNRWLHIYIPEEFPVQCAYKVSQVANFVTLRQISEELQRAMPNLKELRFFVGLPHNNPKILAHIK